MRARHPSPTRRASRPTGFVGVAHVPTPTDTHRRPHHHVSAPLTLAVFIALWRFPSSFNVSLPGLAFGGQHWRCVHHVPLGKVWRLANRVGERRSSWRPTRARRSPKRTPITNVRWESPTATPNAKAEHETPKCDAERQSDRQLRRGTPKCDVERQS